MKTNDNQIKLAVLAGKTCMLMRIGSLLPTETLNNELTDIRTELLPIVGESSEEIAQVDSLFI